VGNKRQREQGSNPAGGRDKRSSSSWTGYSEEVFEEEDEGQWEEDGWIIQDESQKPKRLKQQRQQQQQAEDEVRVSAAGLWQEKCPGVKDEGPKAQAAWTAAAMAAAAAATGT
jgi:hypothetical protein